MVVILEEQDRKPNQVGKSKVVAESWTIGVGGRGLRLKAKPGIAERGGGRVLVNRGCSERVTGKGGGTVVAISSTYIL